MESLRSTFLSSRKFLIYDFFSVSSSNLPSHSLGTLINLIIFLLNLSYGSQTFSHLLFSRGFLPRIWHSLIFFFSLQAFYCSHLLLSLVDHFQSILFSTATSDCSFLISSLILSSYFAAHCFFRFNKHPQHGVSKSISENLQRLLGGPSMTFFIR